jgi:hypothetical protein
VASLFQPELSSDPTWVHPLITAFAAAVRAHAAAPASVVIPGGVRRRGCLIPGGGDAGAVA